jgi:cardiolipin synthase
LPAAPEPRLPPPVRPPHPDAAEAGPLTLPNLITLARLCAVPGTIWLISHGRLDWAFVLFALAGASDGIDGWIARRWHLRSTLGALMDPVADKALLTGAYVTLALIGMMPDWLAIIVVFRDLLITGGVLVLWLAGHAPRIRPLMLSKLNTLMQILFAGLTLFVAGFGPGPGPAMEVMAWGVAAVTIASGLAYAREAARQAR